MGAQGAEDDERQGQQLEEQEPADEVDPERPPAPDLLDLALLVHAEDTEAARQAIELSLNKTADDYRIADNFRRRDGVSTLAVLLRLDEKKGDPLAILGDIEDRWPDDILAAEYIPFKHSPEADSDEKS